MEYDEIIKNESGDGPLIVASKRVEPRVYHVIIKPEDWEYDDIENRWFCKKEVYNENDEQLREASIVEVSIGEERTYKENSLVGKGIILKFIDDIYDRALIHLKAENLIGTFTWLDKEKPQYTLCLVIDELPFLDTPASDFGL